MARVFVYERAVDAVSVDVTLNDNLNCAENGIAIKEEPLDPDIDKTADSLLIVNKNTAVESKLARVRNRNETISYNLRNLSSVGTNRKRRRNVTETLKKIQLRSSQKLSKYVECDVCYLTFQGESALRQHKATNLLVDKSVSYCCDICNGMFLSHVVLNKHKEYCTPSKGQNTSSRRKYICNFCERKFSNKNYLQSHLFHIHQNLISSTETLTNKIKQDEMVDIVDTCKANICCIPDKPKENENNTSLKRMRQTTLTEFLPFFGKCLIKKQEEASTNADKISVSSIAIKNGEQESLLKVSSSNELEGTAMDNETSTERQSLTEKKPFVQIHVNTNTMISLLSTKMKEEDNHKSPMVTTPPSYNFRRLRSDYRSSLHERDSVLARTTRGKKTELWEKEMKTRFNCKECMIRVKRCDGVINGRKWKTNDPECLRVEKDPERVERNVTAPGNREGQITQAKSVNNESIELTNCKKKVFKCKVCKKLFFSKENMREHIDLFHMAYMSSICSARFTSKRKLLNHYLRQHEVFRRKKCCVCYEKLDSLHLSQHMSLHCIQIVLSKQDKSLIGNTRNCNEFKKRNRCKDCGKRFWLNSCLIQHRQISHRTNVSAEKTVPTVEKQVTSIAANIEHSECDSNLSTNHYDRKSNKNSPSANTKTKSPVKESRGQSTTSSSSYNSANSANHKRLITGIACVKGYQVDATVKDKIKYPCSICGKQFQTFQNLCIHERTFNKPADNPCTICGTGFSTKRLLQLHLLATHTPSCTENYKYFCAYCNQGFAKKSNVQIHERHFHANQIATNTVTNVAPQNIWNGNTVNTVCTVCTVCNIVFESYERFIEHNMYYYKGHVFTCTFCGKSFQGMYMLHHHNKLIHYPEGTRNAYTYTCDTCNEGFNQESHFHAHKLHVHLHEASSMQNSTMSLQNCAAYQDHNYAVTADDSISANATIRVPIMTYSCDICSLNFTNEKDLLMHEKEYSSDGDFQCEKCGKKCRTPTFLIKHQSLNHSGSDVGSGYKCRFCGEISTTNTAMVCHEKHFHGINLQQESKDNASEQLDANHNSPTENLVPRAEDDLNKCICLTCGMRFLNEVKLKEHLLEYSDIGAHVCDICHRRFAEKYRLDVHKIKHSRLNHNLSEHHCPICQEGFTSAAHVRTHVMHLHGYETFSSAITKCTNNPNVNARSSTGPCISRRIDSVQEMNKLDRSNETNENVRSNSLFNGGKKISTRLSTSESFDDSDISIISVNEVQKHEVKCPDCGLVFNSSSILTRHKLRFVNYGDYLCQHCDRRFPTLTIFNSHLIKHSADIEERFLKYKCSYCDEKFKTPVSVYSHTAHVHGRNKSKLNSIAVREQSNKTDTNCTKVGEKDTLDISERVFTDDDLEWLLNDDTSSKAVDATKLNGRQTRNLSIEVTHEDRIDKTTANPVKSYKKNSIDCLICNATCADELDLKAHLEKVHFPRSSIDQTFCKTIDTIDTSCTADDSDIVEIIWEKKRPNDTSSEKQLEHHGNSKLEIEATNDSWSVPSIEQQPSDTGDVGKLKVKSFAKITDC